MNKKDKIKKLKKTNPSFVKGTLNTKLSVVVCLLMIFGIQAAMYSLSHEINETALIHMGIQTVAVLLMLSGKTIFPVLYLLAMLMSLALGIWLYLPSQSMFYLVQCVFFLLSAFMMLNLLVNKHARNYRKALKELENMKESDQHEEVEEVLLSPEVQTEENIEPAELPEVKESKRLEILCLDSLDFSYGSFSRFLVQHYPFVYLHPRFDLSVGRVQMCISAEGFDQKSDELYSGMFSVYQQADDHQMQLYLEYEDEMGHLCALICADWLMTQKATLMEDGSNVSADLMKKLTETFVLAQDAEKQPFEGFQKL